MGLEMALNEVFKMLYVVDIQLSGVLGRMGSGL